MDKLDDGQGGRLAVPNGDTEDHFARTTLTFSFFGGSVENVPGRWADPSHLVCLTFLV